MSEQERPRARAAQEGLGVLNDRELIALLLGTGHKGRSAESLAQEVLELAQGCLNNLASWPVESLTVVNGIGPAKATLVAAAMELGRRREGHHRRHDVVEEDPCQSISGPKRARKTSRDALFENRSRMSSGALVEQKNKK